MINNFDSINYFETNIITKNGISFDANNDIWIIRDITQTIKMDFNLIKISKKHIYGLKKTLVWYMENNSAAYVNNIYYKLKMLIDFLYDKKGKEINLITEIDLINFRSAIASSREHLLGYIAGFLKKWYKRGYKIIDKSSYDFLDKVKIKGNKKGTQILTMCPINGPFTDLELERIQFSINNAYANGKFIQDDYILIWLFIIYGSRPIQFAQLKVKDIVVAKTMDNLLEVIINIPRAKNRLKGRSEFKKRIIPSFLSNILCNYIESQKRHFSKYLKNIEETPLFTSVIHSSEEYDDSYIFKYHLTGKQISEKITSILNKLNLISERTSKKMHITARRFRQTIGTRAAQEGHGELIIAEILDHTDTQNVGVYVRSTPEIIERIDSAIAMQMAPIAQAFAGKLIQDKSKAIRSNDLEASIIDPDIDDTCKELGGCGSFSFCGLMSPIACYTCSSFQAWTDGPHEAVLAKLIENRERLLKSTDYRIASINDNIILAVAQVVRNCKKYKEENIIEVIQ